MPIPRGPWTLCRVCDPKQIGRDPLSIWPETHRYAIPVRKKSDDVRERVSSALRWLGRHDHLPSVPIAQTAEAKPKTYGGQTEHETPVLVLAVCDTTGSNHPVLLPILLGDWSEDETKTVMAVLSRTASATPHEQARDVLAALGLSDLVDPAAYEKAVGTWDVFRQRSGWAARRIWLSRHGA